MHGLIKGDNVALLGSPGKEFGFLGPFGVLMLSDYNLRHFRAIFYRLPPVELILSHIPTQTVPQAFDSQDSIEVCLDRGTDGK